MFPRQEILARHVIWIKNSFYALIKQDAYCLIAGP
jgi:hypothetical protein